MGRINNILRKIYNKLLRSKLHNKTITLIASNCTGAAMLHDLNLQFNSPFVNLWLLPKDFIKFCERIDHYVAQNLTFIEEPGIDYPVGLLGDIKIFFQHYSSKEEAFETWNRRKLRIDKRNIFIMFTDRDGCDYEDLVRFDHLKFQNKVVFVHIPQPDIKSSYYIPGFENDNCVGQLLYFKNRYTYKKYYDSFNFVQWFNSSAK